MTLKQMKAKRKMDKMKSGMKKKVVGKTKEVKSMKELTLENKRLKLKKKLIKENIELEEKISKMEEPIVEAEVKSLFKIEGDDGVVYEIDEESDFNFFETELGYYVETRANVVDLLKETIKDMETDTDVSSYDTDELEYFEGDLEMYKDDLKFLESINDEYIFKDYGEVHNYITETKDRDLYNSIIDEIVEFYKNK